MKHVHLFLLVSLLAACGGSKTPPPEPPPAMPADAGATSEPGVPATPRSSSPVRLGAVVVTGKVDRDAVVKVLRGQSDRFHACVTDPKLDGRITLHFDIVQDGRVANITADRASDIEDQKIQACALHVLEVMIFPMPTDGLPAKVIAPIIFEARPTE